MKRLIAIFFAATLLCAAQTQFPDTPAAHQFSAWLDAFNGGDRAVLLVHDVGGLRQPHESLGARREQLCTPALDPMGVAGCFAVATVAAAAA